LPISCKVQEQRWWTRKHTKNARAKMAVLLPMLSEMGVHTMVVTSAVIPIPKEWTTIPKIRVTVSVDGLPEHHDVRRKRATHDRILRNIAGCRVNIHWTITAPMLHRAGYLEEYLTFWNARAEVVRIWARVYTPQESEHSVEMLSVPERLAVAEELTTLQSRYPKLLMSRGIARAITSPPATETECMFARMSTNYSADLLELNPAFSAACLTVLSAAVP
jgi:hypothetical protein